MARAVKSVAEVVTSACLRAAAETSEENRQGWVDLHNGAREVWKTANDLRPD